MVGVQALAEKRVWKGKDYPDCSGDQKGIPLVSSNDAQQSMYKRKLSEGRSRSGTTQRAGAQALSARAGNFHNMEEIMENPLCRDQMSCVGPIKKKKNQAEKQAFSYIKIEPSVVSNTLNSSTQEVEGVGSLSTRPAISKSSSRTVRVATKRLASTNKQKQKNKTYKK